MSGGRDSLRLRFTGAGWLAAWRMARMLPEDVARRTFERFGERSWKRNARRRAVVRENLRPVVPAHDLEEVVREAFRSYGRYWSETFRLEDLRPEDLDRRFRCEGYEVVESAFAGGRGVVLAVPHLGNWDAGGRWVAARWPFTVVAEVVRPRALFYRFVAHRRSMGMRIIPLVRGEDVTGRCLEHLARGEVVGLVADRDLSGRGVEVRMFGKRTTMPAGPAVLALRAGAPLLPACIYMEPGGRWLAQVADRIDAGVDPADPGGVAALTQRLATTFEGMIGRRPEQWHAFQPYWLS
ncbi:MAG: phosphatidylinositol mannoside acyltransferase [Acidobacteria bacterium]|nr:phosphatidylinositol mannoside acyltransferase [Acidobacteriota bacterium]